MIKLRTKSTNDSTLIFEDDRWLGVSSEKRDLMLELAIKVVKLKEQEVGLIVIQIFLRLQINGDIVLDSYIKDVTEISFKFLSK